MLHDISVRLKILKVFPLTNTNAAGTNGHSIFMYCER